MQPPDCNYAAVRTITYNGVIAYNPGDLVPDSAVSGPDAWLSVGDDVEPRPGLMLDQPAKSASQTAWAAYAVSQGADRADAEGMTRAQLIAAYGPDKEAGNVDAGQAAQ